MGRPSPSRAARTSRLKVAAAQAAGDRAAARTDSATRRGSAARGLGCKLVVNPGGIIVVEQEVGPNQSSALKRVSVRGLNLLVGGRDWLQRQWSCLWEQGSGYLPTLREEFEESVAWQTSKLDALEGIEQTTRVTVEDAARCYYTEHWSVLSTIAFRERRLLRAVVVVAGLIILAIPFRFIFPHPPSVISWDSLVILGVLFVPLFLTYAILQRLNALVRHKYLTAFIFFQAFVAFTAVSAINHNRSPFEGRFRALLSSHYPSIFFFDKAQIAATAKQLVLVIQEYFWCVAVIAVMMGLWELIRRYGWSIVGKGKAIDYDWPARQNAELIIEMLDINYVLHTLLGAEVADIETLDAETRSKWFRVMTQEKGRLTQRLNNLVTTIVKPWRAAMWSCNGAAGQWVADQAPRIAFFIEHYQTRILLTGCSLIELRDAMNLALRQAAEGNWHLIGAEFDSVKVSRRTRWKNVLRRFLIILLAALAALGALLWKSLSPQVRLAMVSTCSLLILLQLAALIDPDAPGLASTASGIISSIRGGS